MSWELSLYGGTFEESHPEWDATITYRQRIQVTSSVLHRFIKWPGSSSTSIEYTHWDHLGSVDAITTLTQIQGDQDIYGSRGFTGHEHLDHTGIIHMNRRISDPRLGRFLQPDPIVQSPSFSQSYNRYAYVFNSPLSFTDPSGFEGCESPLGCIDKNKGGTVSYRDYSSKFLPDIFFSPVLAFFRTHELQSDREFVNRVRRSERVLGMLGRATITSGMEAERLSVAAGGETGDAHLKSRIAGSSNVSDGLLSPNSLHDLVKPIPVINSS